jgi:hypothetical protein
MRLAVTVALILALTALTAAAQPSPGPAPSASASAAEPAPDIVKITGGDWHWEIQGRSAVGDGAGKMTVYYRDIVVACEKAHVDRQAKTTRLSKNVTAKYHGVVITGGTIDIDGAKGEATVSGRPTAEDAAHGMKITADALSLVGAAGKSRERVVNASGNVVGSGKYESTIATDAMEYAPDTGRLTIPGAFHGEVTGSFVQPHTSPFFGQRLKIDGKSLVATQTADGRVDMQAAGCELSSPTSRMSAPKLSGYSADKQYHLELASEGDLKVTGYLIEPPAASGEHPVQNNFVCDHLTADTTTGGGELRGAVKVWRTGLSLSTDLLTVERGDAGNYLFKSPGPAKVEYDAGALRRKMKDKHAAPKSN